MCECVSICRRNSNWWRRLCSAESNVITSYSRHINKKCSFLFQVHTTQHHVMPSQAKSGYLIFGALFDKSRLIKLAAVFATLWINRIFLLAEMQMQLENLDLHHSFIHSPCHWRSVPFIIVFLPFFFAASIPFVLNLVFFSLSHASLFRMMLRLLQLLLLDGWMNEWNENSSIIPA